MGKHSSLIDATGKERLLFDDVPLVKGGLITYPAAQCIYGLFAYIYWHLRILTPSIQEPGLHNTALSPTM